MFDKASRRALGYADMPLLSVPSLSSLVLEQKYITFDFDYFSRMTDTERKDFVFIVQDPFTSFYDAKTVADMMALIKHLGKQPVLLPFKPNGKPQHVKGFLKRFAKTAQSASDFLNKIHLLNIPMIGMDASLVLCYRDEYKQILGDKRGNFNVLLAHEWLASELPELSVPALESDVGYSLFGHCTEKTALPNSEGQWQEIFAAFGLNLNKVAVGCCGMAGTYGHEVSNLENSQNLYKMSWQPKVDELAQQQVLATGFSCRSQVKRMASFKPKHPVTALVELINH